MSACFSACLLWCGVSFLQQTTTAKCSFSGGLACGSLLLLLLFCFCVSVLECRCLFFFSLMGVLFPVIPDGTWRSKKPEKRERETHTHPRRNGMLIFGYGRSDRGVTPSCHTATNRSEPRHGEVHSRSELETVRRDSVANGSFSLAHASIVLMDACMHNGPQEETTREATSTFAAFIWCCQSAFCFDESLVSKAFA